MSLFNNDPFGNYFYTPSRPTVFSVADQKAAAALQQKIEQASKMQAEQTASPTKPIQRYRAFRFIEYAGTMEWINDCIARRGVKGTKVLGSKCGVDNVIREGMIGDGVEALDTRPLPDFFPLRQTVADIRSLKAQLSDLHRYGFLSQEQCAARLEKIAQALSDKIYSVEKACK